MNNRRATHTVVLSAALLIAAGPYLVRTARATGQPGGSRANVDLHQVYQESEAKQAADARTGAFARRLDQRFTELAQISFLTPVELRDLSLVLVKDAPVEADTKRAADIKGEGEKRAAEANALAQKKDADLTTTDRNRMRELNGMRQLHVQALAKVQALYQQMVNEENEKNERAGTADVRALVSKLARDKGITEVFDSSTMIVAPVDLTKEAIEKVKKKK